MNILGISAFYHDSAACFIKDGKIISAIQEERFTRKKGDSSFPKNAIDYCLSELKGEKLDLVTFYDKPFVKFERILESYLAFAPHGLNSFLKSMPVWIKQKLWMKDYISKELKYDGKMIFPTHHESHAASAFFPSPFKEAAFLTIDGVGEWATTCFGTGKDNKIEILYEMHFPHSLGLLYSAFTYYTGFKVNSGEYKVMGLAPYGKPIYKKIILDKIIDLKEDGSFKINIEYFDYAVGLTMTNQKFNNLFGGPPRVPETKLTQKEMDLAASIQEVTNEIMLKMALHVKKETGMKNLCLGGGVALNCVANGEILREKIFDKIWIQPASGDAGGSLGAALFAWHQYLGNPRLADGINDSMQGAYLGPEYNNNEIKNFLIKNKIPHKKINRENLAKTAARLINDQKVIGWFQGRMEFGPRALGNRSILADARSPKMQALVNLKIKFREGFRPFAPSVLMEKTSEYFDLNTESPYMLLVAPVLEKIRKKTTKKKDSLWGIDKLNVPRSTIPAVTHIDYSARIQTVNKKDNPKYYDLIKTFDKNYHCPVIINTSFNVRGEPIVCTPLDAYLCFMHTNTDYLVLGNFLLDKKEQKKLPADKNWLNKFSLD